MSQLLLALDTSGKHGSVALARVAGEAEVTVVEAAALAGGTFSAELVPQIAGLLARHGFKPSDLCGFAVVSGPGSFTGLRVGLAAIKALAEVLQEPIAAISLLEAVAWSAGGHGRVLAARDAGRSEVYVGDYEVVDFPHMHSERLLTREEFLAEARDAAVSAEASRKAGRVVTPDAALGEMLHSAGVPCELVAYPTSEVIARLGWHHIQAGRTVGAEELEANYIRRSDAEIFSPPRH